MASWIFSVIGLLPGLAISAVLWWERRKRAKAEAVLAVLRSEFSALNEIYARESGLRRTAEKALERKEAYIELLEDKMAEDDPASLVDGLFSVLVEPPKN
jgi:hypothetical protein